MKKLWILFTLCAAAIPLQAAEPKLTAIDFSSCHAWRFNTLDKDSSVMGRSANGLGPRWFLMDAVRENSTGKLHKRGICHIPETLGPIQCLSGTDFPLAGAIFEPGSTRHGPVTYYCAKGCNKTKIEKLYDHGIKKDTPNRIFVTDLQRAKKTCGPKANRW